MENGDIIILGNLLKSLEEVILKMEEYYNKKESANFQKTKILAIQIQKKIIENLK